MKPGKISLFFFFMTFFIFTISIPSLHAQAAVSLTSAELKEAVKDVDLVVLYDQDASDTITLDGVVSDNEYSESFYSEITEMTVSMVHNGSYLFVGMEAPSKGYVAVGFNKPGFGMVGADIKFGYMTDSGETSFSDGFAQFYGMPSQNEENDTVSYAVTESDNGTVIEFIMPMQGNVTDLEPVSSNSDITKDQKLEIGKTYALLYAWANEDYMWKHLKKAIHSMFIAPEGILPREKINLDLTLDQSSGDKNTLFSGTATLMDSSNSLLEGMDVSLYMDALIADVEVAHGVTNASGQVSFNFTIFKQYNDDLALYAKFKGDLNYTKGDSTSKMISYSGHEEEEAPVEGRVFGEDLNFIVPYMTGFGALAVVAFMWCCFAYVIYTVLFLNSKESSQDKEDASEGGD